MQLVYVAQKVKGYQEKTPATVEHGARWFSHASVLPFITSDNDELSEVIKMLGNKEFDFPVNGIISDNFR